MEFKLFRYIWRGLIGMLLMLPMGWISFRFLNLTGGITKGLLQFSGSVEEGGEVFLFFFGAFLGVIIVCLFPIHWVLIFRSNDLLLLLAIVLPWILASVIVCGLSAKSPKDGFFISLFIGIGYFALMTIFYIIISLLLARFGGGRIIDAVTSGLTGMPFLLSAFLATMEGAGVAAVFGALIGSIKYKPGGSIKKEKKSKKEIKAMVEPTFTDTSESTIPSEITDDFCTNCGAKLLPGDEFCTNCGNKVK
ncbi:MAG: zinc ribbon domain-containing protein [Promethearchaeota archaeon]